jgi:3-oxoacyl-[acyl-carrier-protein] synthase II
MLKRVVVVTPKTMEKNVEEELFNAQTLSETEIKKSFEDFLTKAETLIPYNTLRRICRFSALAMYSNILAAKDSGIVINEKNADCIGSIMNTIYGPLKVTENFLNTLIKSGPQSVSPADFANTVINCATGQVSMHLKIKGVSSTLVGSSGLTYAYEMIRNSKADALFVSAVEEYHQNVEANYSSTVAFSENSVCLLLEDYDHAKARDAKIYGEILGCGIGTDTEQRLKIDSISGTGLKAALANNLDLMATLNKEGYLVSASLPALSDIYEKEIEIMNSFIKIKDIFPWKSIFGEALGVNEVLAAAISALFLSENKFIAYNSAYDIKTLEKDALVISNSCQPGGCWSTIFMKKVIE